MVVLGLTLGTDTARLLLTTQVHSIARFLGLGVQALDQRVQGGESPLPSLVRHVPRPEPTYRHGVVKSGHQRLTGSNLPVELSRVTQRIRYEVRDQLEPFLRDGFVFAFRERSERLIGRRRSLRFSLAHSFIHCFDRFL